MNSDKQMPEPEEKRVPGWVFVAMLLFLVLILLGVESALNWLLPAGR